MPVLPVLPMQFSVHSVTSEQILRRKREIDMSSGQFTRPAYADSSVDAAQQQQQQQLLQQSLPVPPQQLPPLPYGGYYYQSDNATVTSTSSSEDMPPTPPHLSLPQVRPTSHSNVSSTTTTPSTTGGSQRNSHSSAAVAPPRKKVAKLVIPSDDVRRQYAVVFAEGFNSMDKNGLRDLLYKYANPECVAVYKYVGNPNPLYGPVYCQLVGLDAIANYWTAIFSAVPDSVFEMQENKLRALPSGYCAIVMKFIFSGTKIFRISADNHESVLYSNHDPDAVRSGDSVVSAMSDHTASFPAGLMSSTPAPQQFTEEQYRESAVSKRTDTLKVDGCLERSVPITLLGTMTFYTHPDKQIHKIEVVYCVRA